MNIGSNNSFFRCIACTIQSMFELWLEKGIDGILLADIEVLLEAADPTLDEPQPEEEEEENTQPLVRSYIVALQS